MLEVYFGSNTIGVRQAAQKAVVAYTAEGLRIERFEPRAGDEGRLIEMAGSVSLFGPRTVYVIDTPEEEPDFFAALLESARALAESSNTIVIITGPLTAVPKKALTSVADVAVEDSVKTAETETSIFALADALSNRDKKTLWLLLARKQRSGIAAEEIIGTLWWQLKTLQLASITGSAAEAGMKDFPYNKAKRALKNFKPGELQDLMTSLLAVYHDGHAGRRDIDLALEEWVLRG